FDGQRRRLDRDLERVSPLGDLRRRELGRRTDHVDEIERRPTKLDLASRDACEIEQIVDEAYEMRDLTLHHRVQALESGRLIRGLAHQLDAGPQRREGITQ